MSDQSDDAAAGVIQEVLEALDDLPEGSDADPEEMPGDITKEMLKEMEYRHDVDDDDPPPRTGPYPAGGPS